MVFRRSLSRASARGVLLGLGVALAPLPAAADTTAKQPAPNLRAAIAKLDQRSFTAPATAVRLSTQANAPTESPRFFKTKTGVLVAAIFAAGVGYAIYSAHSDRIHSPGKQ